MNAIILLFSLGIVLLVVEVIVPGGILGVIGGIAMLGGCAVAFHQYGTTGGSVATASALAILGVVLYVEFVWLPKTRHGKKLFVQSRVDSTSQPPLADASVVGKTGEAVTPLVPSGYVAIEGRRYEVYSRSGHLPAGTRVVVTAIDNFRLTVTKA